jgi:hypothetical protein
MVSPILELTGVGNAAWQSQRPDAADDSVDELSLVTPPILLDKHPLAVPTVPFQAFGGNQARQQKNRKNGASA